MRTHRRTFSLLAALITCALLAGCSESAGSLGSSGDKGYISGKGVITTLAVSERERPGEVSGETIDGEPISLADYAGQIVVVNVWGSWCAPCRAEAPDLVAAAKELADDNVAFLGINSRDLNQAAAKAFVRRFEVPYPSIYDQKGRTLLAFHGTLTPNSIPSTVIIDAKGRVAASVLGEVTKTTLVDLVEEVSTGSTNGAAGSTDGDDR